MDDLERKSFYPRLVISVALTLALAYFTPIDGISYSLFFYPLIAIAIHVWLGIILFFVDIIWKLIAKPEERLFASIMLTGTVFVLVVVAAAYWLIRDSIGLGATIMYAMGAYCIFAIVRWFRRHTASYYASLDADQASDSKPED